MDSELDAVQMCTTLHQVTATVLEFISVSSELGAVQMCTTLQPVNATVLAFIYQSWVQYRGVQHYIHQVTATVHKFISVSSEPGGVQMCTTLHTSSYCNCT